MSRTYWLTGLPSSGKTTLGSIFAQRIGAQLLDDNAIRDPRISPNIGLAFVGRRKHLLRIAEVSRILNDNGIEVVTCFVSPFRSIRAEVEEIIDDVRLVWIRCPGSVCRQRDPDGLWDRAIKGRIRNFAGWDIPFERPLHPHLTINSNLKSIDECVAELIRYRNSLCSESEDPT